MKTKHLLYIPIILSLGWLGADLTNPPNTGDFFSLLVIGECIQLLLNKN